MATDDLIVQLDPSKLREIYDPFEALVWDIGTPVTMEEIKTFVDAKSVLGPKAKPKTRDQHMQKIAGFVLNGWDDPIEVDVGIPALGYRPSWGVTDGNHRFVAALIRGEGSISVSFSGQVSEIARLAPG